MSRLYYNFSVLKRESITQDILSMIMDRASYDESDLSGKRMNCRGIVWFRATKQPRPQRAFPQGEAPLETRLSNEDGDLPRRSPDYRQFRNHFVLRRFHSSSLDLA